MCWGASRRSVFRRWVRRSRRGCRSAASAATDGVMRTRGWRGCSTAAGAHGPHRMGPQAGPDAAWGLDGQACPRPSPGPPRFRLERHVDQDCPAARRPGPLGVQARRPSAAPATQALHRHDAPPGRLPASLARHGQPPLNRHALSKAFCRRIGRFKPDGGLKDMMAKITMPAMRKDDPVALPAPRERQNRPGPIVLGPDTEAPPIPAPTTLDEARPLDLRPVVRGARESRLVERVRRPLPLSRIQDPGRRPDALRRP